MRLAAVLPCDPASVARARQMVRAELLDAGLDPVVDPAVLLVSELVTNSIVHARTEVQLRISARRGQLRVEVEDGSNTLPVPRRVQGLTDTGRGLRLVDQLADHWGVRPGIEGKTVWFELRTASSERAFTARLR